MDLIGEGGRPTAYLKAHQEVKDGARLQHSDHLTLPLFTKANISERNKNEATDHFLKACTELYLSTGGGSG